MNTISEKSKIYRDVIIRDSVISDGALLADDSFVINSVIGKNAHIERRVFCNSVKIGFGSYINRQSTAVFCTIGKFCSIGWNVSIVGEGVERHNLPFISTYSNYWWDKTLQTSLTENTQDTPCVRDSIVIGNDVWIGCNSVILDNVTIGDGAVVGAGAVVTKDVEPYSIVVGNPARLLRKRFSADAIKKLLEIKWWDWDPELLKDNIDLINRKADDDLLDKLLQIKQKYITVRGIR